MLEPDRETEVQKKDGDETVKRAVGPRWICRYEAADGNRLDAVIGSQPMVIGAARDSSLVLDDPTVSRNHLEVRLVEDGIQIRDLNSTNGSFYNHSRFDTIIVSGDCKIQLGNSVVEIRALTRNSIPPSDQCRFGGLIGQSRAMREVFSILESACPTDATVLIEGESGTGKEVAARGIHDHSLRSKRPFVVYDCCSSPEHLVESHLFGHKAGAFTGALGDRKGAFLEADGGTLFLDELGELPPSSQGKLLRALEARTVQPVGSDSVVPVNVRVIAATNRNPADMVARKKFRFDLYHRLAVVQLSLPPLRFHLEDIPMLVRHFYETRGRNAGEVGGENLRTLMQHDWPGNVRELRNVMERAWVLSGGDVPFEKLRLMLGAPQQEMGAMSIVDTSSGFKTAKEQWVELFEKQYVSSVYTASRENISRAAEQAGINRNHLRKLLMKHNLVR